jgi:hypothetical protein
MLITQASLRMAREDASQIALMVDPYMIMDATREKQSLVMGKYKHSAETEGCVRIHAMHMHTAHIRCT